MWLNYLQAALQILQIVNALLLTVHANPIATGVIAGILGVGSQLTHVSAMNTEPPPK